ncbi:MAG: pantetheine-phosphate adenylyltransferase [Spirochaetota bacterium]|jgi:pantetheine-phosphate adenylyltransferase|nr:pantetheine-phosphate adenylyltransferase [Spirochaetota bacterium]
MGSRIAVYPGSFDPITFGHLDIARRAAGIFEKIIVAVAEQTGKTPLFSLPERTRLAALACSDLRNIEVTCFSGLLVDFARSVYAQVIIRGLRAVSDFEFEFALSLMNSRLAPEIETVFLPTSEGHSFVSSSMIKEISRLGGNAQGMAPECVLAALMEKFHNK